MEKLAVILPCMVYNRIMSLASTQIESIYSLFNDGIMLKDIVTKVGSNKDTVRRYLNEKYGREYVRTKTIQNFKIRYRHGAENPLWKGGREVSSQGYIRVWINGKRVLEHRYVMEQYLGRKLEKDEDVHHIDMVRDNNHISNLKLMTKSEHSTFHNMAKTPKIPRDNRGRFTKCQSV